MREKWVIVPKVRTGARKILDTLLFVLTCGLLIGAVLYPFAFGIPALACAALWFFLVYNGGIEYEYSYYDGELRFAKIRAKSKRKSLGTVDMEDVIVIAPKGDRSVYKYENDKNVSYKNLGSGNPDAKTYAVVFKGERDICLYEIEPDEELLDAICVKYPRVVIK